MTRFDELRKAARRVKFIDGCAGCCDCTIDPADDGDYVWLEDFEALVVLCEAQSAIISRYRSSSERMSHSFCQLIPGGADTRCWICRDVDGMEAV